MVFKPFSHLSRHASLAKSLWATSQTPQPAFFATTSQLKRQQSQLVVPNNSAFGSSESGSNSTNPHSYSALCNYSHFTLLSPLSTLDDDRRRELLMAEIQNTEANHSIHSHQYKLPPRPLGALSESNSRRTSISSTDKPRPVLQSVRRYSTSTSKRTLEDTEAESTTSAPATESQIEPAQQEQKLLQYTPQTTTPASPIVQSSKVEQTDSTNQSLEKPPSPPPEIIESQPAPTLEQEQYQAIQDSFTNNLISSIESGSQEAVLETFQNLRSNNVTLSLTAYEKTLSFLSSKILTNNKSDNLSNVLSIYTDAVSKHSVKSSNIYSSVISSLLSVANHTAQHKEQNLAFFRLNKRHDIIPQSLQTAMQTGDSSISLYKTALEMFEASNSVHTQNYPVELYQRIVDSCIKVGRYDLLYSVTRMLEVNNCAAGPDMYISLVTGYGRHGDIAAAVETYHHYASVAGDSHPQREYDMYKALVGAYFDCGEPENGLEFVNKILDSQVEPLYLASVISEVILSYCRIGDHVSAMNWIQRVEKDDKLFSVDTATLVQVLSSMTDAQDVTSAAVLFDFIAAKTTSAHDPLFNVSRNDFVTACVKAKDTENLFKAIKESTLRIGVWELATVLDVTKYLISIGDLGFALKIFDVQGSRYFEYLYASGLANDGQSLDAIDTVARALSSANLLDPGAALTLMKSDVFDAQVFADVNGSGIAVVKAFWDDFDWTSKTNFSVQNPQVLVDAIRVHLKWIKFSGSRNSLGGLSIPSDLQEKFALKFCNYLQHLMMGKYPDLTRPFKQDITDALTVLKQDATLAQWTQYCQAFEPKIDSVPPPPPPRLENRTATNQIVLSSQNPNTVMSAVEHLNAALIRDDHIGAEAFVALIQAGAAEKNAGLIHQVYKMALSALPHPSAQPELFYTWVPIHRAVVNTAQIDYEIAQAAYKHLLELGVCPDATGYGQLIANVPAMQVGDEAAHAVTMLNEAKENGVPLNTFIYNVVLSKLAKAHQHKQVLEYLSQMEQQGIKKTNVTYGTVINSCCLCSDEKNARRLFDEMERAPNYAPRVAPFNIMIQFYIYQKKDREEGLKFFERLHETGLKPSIHTYKLLIDAYGMIEPVDIKAADNVLLRILGDNNAINTKHYAALIQARGIGMRDPAAAHEFYDALLYKNRVRPDKQIFQALLETYIANGQVHSTPSLLKDMVIYGIDLDANMTNMLIRAWAPVNFEKAQALFRHLLESGLSEPRSYESIVRAHLYYGDVAGARSVLDLMTSCMYPASTIAQLAAFIDQHSSPATNVTEPMLYESMFGRNVLYFGAASTGAVGQGGADKPNASETLDVFGHFPQVKSEPKLVDF